MFFSVHFFLVFGTYEKCIHHSLHLGVDHMTRPFPIGLCSGPMEYGRNELLLSQPELTKTLLDVKFFLY